MAVEGQGLHQILIHAAAVQAQRAACQQGCDPGGDPVTAGRARGDGYGTHPPTAAWQHPGQNGLATLWLPLADLTRWHS